MTNQPNTAMSANDREDLFAVRMDQLMANVFNACAAKVSEDYDITPESDTVVTERQVEYSLRHVPDTIRSRMIQRCIGYFGARKEA